MKWFLQPLVVLLVASSMITAQTGQDLAVLAAVRVRPRMYKMTVGGRQFTLQEIELGARYGCAEGAYMGVVLKDSLGVTRWSLNVIDVTSYLAKNGCRYGGASSASIVGISVPSKDRALWVIRELDCGASCVGYDVHVFGFSSTFATINPATGYYRTGIWEELSQSLGLGGVKFAFPRLVLYVNNGYKECPSHWTRMTYEWTEIPDAGAKFVLVNAIAYTSHQCYLSNTRWPPDPGE